MASPTPGPSGTPQDQDLGPAQFTYPPVAQNPHQRYPPVPTRTEAVSHPLGSDERRRPADFDSGIRTKAVVVSGPERDQHDQMQQQVQQMMQQQQQMQQQLTSTPSEQSEPQRVMINQQDEDMEDDEMEQNILLTRGKATTQRGKATTQQGSGNAEKRDSRTGGSNSSARGPCPFSSAFFPNDGAADDPTIHGEPAARREKSSAPQVQRQATPIHISQTRRGARRNLKICQNCQRNSRETRRHGSHSGGNRGLFALPRGPTKQAKAIKAQQSRMTKEEDLWWKTQTMVRQVGAKYSTDTAAEFASYVPAERLVQLCNDGIAGPPEDVFILDFSKGYQTSLWNDAIIQKFTMALQAAHRESSDQWGVSEASDLYSREAWAKWQPRLVLDALEMETAEEVKSRVETAEQRRRAKGASNSAKHRKFTRRKSCVQLTLKLKDDQEVDVGTWQYLQDLLERLGKDGMSSEEEGVHDLGTTVVSVYYVKLCVWRAKPITDYMLLIDRSAAEVKTSKGGSSGPRIRANTNPIGTTAAPPGLPRKMYDEQWLAEREKNAPYWVSTTLRVSEEAFQFLVSTMEEDLDL
ncbi:hypothetical protein B0H14DRAFT_2652165 [Mycena olivaceomarginata]|nr:hypothetical protein B0H14DRAFT_2652165 [Mycena olivaceomarginata]